MDEGLWPDVRAALLAVTPSASTWLDTPPSGPWVPLGRYMAMIDALQTVVGPDGTREAGRRRLAGSMIGGTVAPLLRSWTRSYANVPSLLGRVTPHVWTLIVRDAGNLTLQTSDEPLIRFHLERAAEEILQASAWHRFVEGYCAAMLDAHGGSAELTVDHEGRSCALNLRWVETRESPRRGG